MNIAILSDRLLQNGGTESYLLDLINKYLLQGDMVTVFTTKLDRRLDVLKNKNLSVVVQNISACPKKLRFPFYYHFLRKQISKESFDFVIGINSPYCPDVGICCGTYLGSLKSSSWKNKINPLNQLRARFEKRKYTDSNLMVAHSELSKQELIDLYKIPAEKIKVIYPVPPLEKFKWKSADSINQFRKKYNLSLSMTYFLFSSTGHQRKGLQLIIDALKLLNDKNMTVLVAGSLRSNFEDIPNIQYLGYIKDIDELYQACDATILPSTYEPFGLVIVESLLSGTPVIISKNVGAKDLVKLSMGSILDNLTAENLADVMKEYTYSKNIVLDKKLVHQQIEPFINHHSMIKELRVSNNTPTTLRPYSPSDDEAGASHI
ncbi:MAG: glycosyltransferase family 4 protein [Gammaproteobacteria bacterium]